MQVLMRAFGLDACTSFTRASEPVIHQLNQRMKPNPSISWPGRRKTNTDKNEINKDC